VTRDEAKAHCRIDHDEEDALIDLYIAAAVAHLDGWKGVLGRCIMTQEWRQEYTDWGSFRPAMPDVTGVTVRYCTEEVHGHSGEHVYELATDVTVTLDGQGTLVTATGPSTDNIHVDYTCAMPAQQLPAVKAIILLLVGHWYAHREAVTVGSVAEVPMAVDMLCNAMRWRLL
jgi:uncharacterized phiE125 gp8 family phage protein